MNSSYTNVSALIPTGLVPEFYRWVATAHGVTDKDVEISPKLVPEFRPLADFAAFVDMDPELIRAWWAKLSRTAREVLTLMARNADERFTGTELAEECENLAGPSGAAGTFNWPSRYAKGMGFEGPWVWDHDLASYYMPGTAAAVLLAAVETVNN